MLSTNKQRSLDRQFLKKKFDIFPISSNDTEAEINVVREAALANGAFDAIVARHYSEGGQGALELANALIRACDSKSDFHYLYDVNGSIEEKIFKIASEMYGAAEIELHSHVKDKIQLYNAQVSFLYVISRKQNRHGRQNAALPFLIRLTICFVFINNRATINYRFAWQKLQIH